MGNAAICILNLRQGPRSAASYFVEFQTLAVDSRWNAEALRGMFLNGLGEHLKDEWFLVMHLLSLIIWFPRLPSSITVCVNDARTFRLVSPQNGYSTPS